MTQPTQDQIDALVNATGKAVLFPRFRDQVTALDDIEAWAQARGMGPLASFFALCAGNPIVVKAVENVDVKRKSEGIESVTGLWEDEVVL